MARVTVEDCLDNVDNRFELVLVATKRARQLANGVQPLVDWENDKPTIVALREIAEGLIGPSILDEPLHPVVEEEVEDETEVDATAEAVAAPVDVKVNAKVDTKPGVEADTSAPPETSS